MSFQTWNGTNEFENNEPGGTTSARVMNGKEHFYMGRQARGHGSEVDPKAGRALYRGGSAFLRLGLNLLSLFSGLKYCLI